MADNNSNGKFTAKEVRKGDIIRSADWNDAINEIQRLGDTTTNLNKNNFKGALTIEEALTVKGNLTIGTKSTAEVNLQGTLNITDSLTVTNNITAGSLQLNEVSINKFQTDSSLGDNNNSVPTEGAVKNYVDNAVKGDLTKDFQAKDLRVNDVLAIGDTPFENNTGGNREWMTKGLKIFSNSDNLFIGLKNEGDNRKDAVIAWGDDTDDNLRFIHAAYGGGVNGNEVMKLTPAGNLSVTGNISGNIDATNITSGTLKVERIPNLSANKITGGTIQGNLNVYGDLKIGNLYAVKGEQKFRIIRGVIEPKGGIYSGEGFVSKRLKTGIYEITFLLKFSDVPAVIATQVFPGDINNKEGGNPQDNTVVITIGKQICRIKCGDSNGSASDRIFSFLCIGS